MSAKWRKVRLGELLNPVSREEAVDAMKEYRLLGVRLDGQGPFLRQVITGAQSAATKLFRVAQGDFIYSRLFASRGAFGIISSELSGCYVSGEFPTFVPEPEKIDAGFLRYWFQLPSTLERVAENCSGSTPLTRNRFKEEFFLALEIPLPPLPEQRRIVARIEELAAKIEEARALRQEAKEEGQALVLSSLHRLFVTELANWKSMPMEQAIEISDKQVDPTLPEYSRLPHISGENMESKTCRLLPWHTAEEDSVKSNNYLFSPGTVLYSKIRPYLRKAVFVDFQGVCSADVYPIRVIDSELDPNFVKWTLVAEPFTDYANRLSGRTRMPKLNRKQLFGFPFTYPPRSEQRRIVAELEKLQAQVDGLKRLQAETANEFDALLPAIFDRAFKGGL